eukprot:745968-Hanusia_phi.AAC.1
MHSPSEEERRSINKVNEWLKSEHHKCSSPSMTSSKKSSSQHLGSIFQLMEEAESEAAFTFDFLAISSEEHNSSETAVTSLLSLPFNWSERSSSGSKLGEDANLPEGRPSSLDLTGMLGSAVEGLLGTSAAKPCEDAARSANVGGLHEWEAKAMAASWRARKVGIVNSPKPSPKIVPPNKTSSIVAMSWTSSTFS